jgi:hypothetical protein
LRSLFRTVFPLRIVNRDLQGSLGYTCPELSIWARLEAGKEAIVRISVASRSTFHSIPIGSETSVEPLRLRSRRKRIKLLLRRTVDSFAVSEIELEAR